jgi:hypothetical protein
VRTVVLRPLGRTSSSSKTIDCPLEVSIAILSKSVVKLTWGEVVYCVEHWDKHSLLTILNSELYTDNGYTLEDLTIIEFEYTGEYIIFIPQMRFYNNERFILIKEPIDKTKITEIKASIEYLKHIN